MSRARRPPSKNSPNPPGRRASRKDQRPADRPRSGREAPSGAQEIWLTGLHSVREALRARRRPLYRLWIREGRARDEAEELLDLARAAGIPIESVSRDQLIQVAEPEANPQGVGLLVGPLSELSLTELLASTASQGPGRRFVALDGVEDPQNVGAITRVADSAGVSGLILTDRRAPGLTPAVARASAGAIEWLPVGRVGNLGRALAELQKEGFWVLAAAPGGQQTLYEMEDRHLTGDLVVVLGAEGRGVRPSILEKADFRVEIPMRGRVESLNVSTAGAVLLFELLRRAESSPAG